MLEPCRHFPTEQIYHKEKLEKYIINHKRYKHILKRLHDILQEGEDNLKKLQESTCQLIAEIKEIKELKPKNKNSNEYLYYIEQQKNLEEKNEKYAYLEKLLISKIKTITETIDFVLFLGDKLENDE